jgi:hypothetical protein
MVIHTFYCCVQFPTVTIIPTFFLKGWKLVRSTGRDAGLAPRQGALAALMR